MARVPLNRVPDRGIGPSRYTFGGGKPHFVPESRTEASLLFVPSLYKLYNIIITYT